MALDLYTSHTQRKKIDFEALKMGIDLYTSSTHTRVNTVIARNCDWFTVLFATVVIGWSNCFGVGFLTFI